MDTKETYGLGYLQRIFNHQHYVLLRDISFDLRRSQTNHHNSPPLAYCRSGHRRRMEKTACLIGVSLSFGACKTTLGPQFRQRMSTRRIPHTLLLGRCISVSPSMTRDEHDQWHVRRR